MIFFGTRGVKSTLEEGTFICPQCANEQHYKHKKVTRFFTLYFIPLIPLGKAGEFVECQNCQGTFVPRVLDFDPDQGKNEFESLYEKALRHSMVLMMLADGEIDENEMITVHKIINKFSHHDITFDELKTFVKVVEDNAEPIETYLSKISSGLNEHGKEVIIKCALSVASADGVVDSSELKLIHEMAQAMEMSKAHLKGILSEIAEDKPTFSAN